MAERNEFARPFRSHNSGNPCGSEYVALLRSAIYDSVECFFGESNSCLRSCVALGRLLRGDIHHPRGAALTKMGQTFHVPTLTPINREVAAATSASRIRLSPTRKARTLALASRSR